MVVVNWLGNYQSHAKKNKWYKISNAARKASEGRRLIQQEDARTAREERLKRERAERMRQSLMQFKKRERNYTPAPIHTVGRKGVDYGWENNTPQWSPRLADNPPDLYKPKTGLDAGYSRATAGQGAATLEAERDAEEKKKREDELEGRMRDFKRIDADVSRKEHDLQLDKALVDLKFIDSPTIAALGIVFNRDSAFDVDIFDTNSIKQFVLDVRSGNFSRLKELLQPGNTWMEKIVNQARFSFGTKYEGPKGLPEGMIVAPTLKEFMKWDMNDLIQQATQNFSVFDKFNQADMSDAEGTFFDSFNRQTSISFLPEREYMNWGTYEGNLANRGKVVVEGSTARAFLAPITSRNFAANILALSWEEQSDFIASWVYSQSSLIEEGRFDELIPVPIFAEGLTTELHAMLTKALREQRPLTDEERGTAIFLAYATGWKEIEYTREEQRLLEKYITDNSEAQKVEKEKKGFSIGGFLKNPPGALAELTGVISDEGLTAVEEYEFGHSVEQDQIFLRGEMEDAKGLQAFLETPLGQTGMGLMWIFEKGETYSRPFMRDTLVPILSGTVPRILIGEGAFMIAEQIISAPSTVLGIEGAPDIRGDLAPVKYAMQGINKGLESAGVPEVYLPTVGLQLPTIPTGDIPLMPDIRIHLETPSIGITRVPDIERMSREAIESEIFEAIGTELLNPANIIFVIPFIGPGSRFARAAAQGNKLLMAAIIADEFMLTGNTPGLIKGGYKAIVRGLESTTRIGLNNTLKKWPWLMKQPEFKRLVAGFEAPMHARAAARNIRNISAMNLEAAQKNRILRMFRNTSVSADDAQFREFDEELVRKVHEVHKANIHRYVEFEYVGTGADVARPLQETAVDQMRKGTWMGYGYDSGRPQFSVSAEGKVIDVPVESATKQANLSRVATHGDGVSVDNVVQISDGTVDDIVQEGSFIKRQGDESLQKPLSEDQKDVIERVFQDPTRKPFGSGFIMEVMGVDYELLVAHAVKRAEVLTLANPGRKFFLREVIDKNSGIRILSVFGADDTGIRMVAEGAEEVGLPTGIKDFIHSIDSTKEVGKKKEFITKVFNFGKDPEELSRGARITASDNGIRAYQTHVMHIDRGTNVGARLGERDEAVRGYLELAAARLATTENGKPVENLGDVLVSRTEKRFDTVAQLEPGSNGLIDINGRIFDLGDEKPSVAVARIFDSSTEATPASKAGLENLTDTDLFNAKVTRYLDETQMILVTRRGDTLIVDSVNKISQDQIDVIKSTIINDKVKRVEFARDTVFGTRATGKQVSHRGKVGEELYHALDEAKRIEYDSVVTRANRLLDGQTPTGDTIGAISADFSPVPDPIKIRKLTQLFKVFNTGEPPPEGIGLILPDGRIIYMGNGVDGFHATYLGRALGIKPKTVVQGAEEGLQEATTEADKVMLEYMNATGAVKYRNMGGSVHFDVYRPTTFEQRSAAQLPSKVYANRMFETTITLYDGSSVGRYFDEILNVENIKRGLYDLTSNPPDEWKPLIDAMEISKRLLDQDISAGRLDILVKEGHIPGPDARIIITDGPDAGKVGTVKDVRKGAYEIILDDDAGDNIRFFSDDVIDWADANPHITDDIIVDASTGLPKGTQVSASAYHSFYNSMPMRDLEKIYNVLLEQVDKGMYVGKRTREQYSALVDEVNSLNRILEVKSMEMGGGIKSLIDAGGDPTARYWGKVSKETDVQIYNRIERAAAKLEKVMDRGPLKLTNGQRIYELKVSALEKQIENLREYQRIKRLSDDEFIQWARDVDGKIQSDLSDEAIKASEDNFYIVEAELVRRPHVRGSAFQDPVRWERFKKQMAERAGEGQDLPRMDDVSVDAAVDVRYNKAGDPIPSTDMGVDPQAVIDADMARAAGASPEGVSYAAGARRATAGGGDIGKPKEFTIREAGLSEADNVPSTIDKQREFLADMHKKLKVLEKQGAPQEEITQLKIDIANYKDTLARQDPVGFERRPFDSVDAAEGLPPGTKVTASTSAEKGSKQIALEERREKLIELINAVPKKGREDPVVMAKIVDHQKEIARIDKLIDEGGGLEDILRLSDEEFEAEMLGRNASTKPLSQDAEKLLTRIEDGKLTVGSMTDDEIENLRKIAAANDLVAAPGTTPEKMVQALINKKALLGTTKRTAEDQKIISALRSKLARAIVKRDALMGPTSQGVGVPAMIRAQANDAVALARTNLKEAVDVARLPKAKPTGDVASYGKKESSKILVEAEDTRTQAKDIMASLTKVDNTGDVEKQIREVVELYAKADALEAEAGIPRTISSIIGGSGGGGIPTSAEEELRLTKQLLKGDKAGGVKRIVDKESRRYLKSRETFLKDQIKTWQKLNKSHSKNMENLENQIRRLENKKIPAEGDEAKIAGLKERLLKEKMYLIEDMDTLTPLEAVRHLESSRAHAMKMSETVADENVVSQWKRRMTDIDNTITYIESQDGMIAGLKEEQSRAYDNLIEQAMVRHEEELRYLDKSLREIGADISNLFTYRLSSAPSDATKKVSKLFEEMGGARKLTVLYERESTVLSRMKEIRADVHDAVDILTRPLDGSGRFLNIDDMDALFAARGWRGNMFQTFINKEYESIPGLKQVMKVFRGGVGLYDPSFVLGNDRWGRKIIALAKMENYAMGLGIEDSRKLLALANPFEFDKTGRVVDTSASGGGKGNLPLGDMIEDWAKWKGGYGAEHNEYVEAILKIQTNVQDFVESQGLKIPQIWKEVDKVFREVTHVIGTDYGKIDLDTLNQRIVAQGGSALEPGSLRHRMYETMLDGYNNGIRYNMDVATAMIHKSMAVRKWAVNKAFMNGWVKEHGALKADFIRGSTRRTKEIADAELAWVDELQRYAGASSGGKPKMITLIDDELMGIDVPQKIKDLRDEIDKINKSPKFTKAKARELIGRSSRKGSDGEMIPATGMREQIEEMRELYSLRAREAREQFTRAAGSYGGLKTDPENFSGVTGNKKFDYSSVMVRATPPEWGTGNVHLFMKRDVDYMVKHWGKTEGNLRALTVGLLGGAGRITSGARIIQTGADFGGWLVNLLPIFGHDMYRGLAAIPTGIVDVARGEGFGAAAEVRALPIVSPLLDTVGRGLKALGFEQSVIQGGDIWSKSVWNSMTAFFNQKATAKWWLNEATKNPGEWARFKKHARVSGLPHEFGEFSTFEKWESAIPGLKKLQPMAKFQQSFTQILTGAAWLYWKSLDHLATDVNKLEQLGSLSRNIVGIHAGQELGIHAGQLGVERLMFYAPSFMRASFAVFANAAFQPTTFGGRQALKSIAGLSASVTMIAFLYSATTQAKLTGYDPRKWDWDSLGDDIKESWNPSGGRFWAIRAGDGILGLGGAYRSNMAFIGRLLGAGVEWNPTLKDPLNDFKLKPPTDIIDLNWDNPFAKWYRGKGSIPVGAAWDFIEGKDFIGRLVDPLTPQYWAETLSPFWLQAMVESRQGFGLKSLGIGGSEFFGARYYRINPSQIFWEKAADTLGYSIEEVKRLITRADGSEEYAHKSELDALKDGSLIGSPEGEAEFFERQGEFVPTLDGVPIDEDAEPITGVAPDIEPTGGYPSYVRGGEGAIIGESGEPIPGSGDDYITNGYDPKKIAEAEEAWKAVEEDRRARGSEGQWVADELALASIDADRQQADVLLAIDGTIGSGENVSGDLNSIKDVLEGQRIQIFRNGYGGDDEDIDDPELDIRSLSPTAQIAWAFDIDNFRNEITGEHDYDAQQAFIDKQVYKLSPTQRALFLRYGYARLGVDDTKAYKAGAYDDANNAARRRMEVSVAYEKLERAPKYVGLTDSQADSVDQLLDVATMMVQMAQIRGDSLDRRDIFRKLIEVLPGNQTIVKYALISTYSALRPLIMSSERQDILMENPDLMVFYPYLINRESDEFKEDYEERWGFGQNTWTGSGNTMEDYLENYRSSLGYLRDNPPEEDDGLLGIGVDLGFLGKY